MTAPVGVAVDAIPAELKAERRWALWRYAADNGRGKPRKIPYQPNGLPASHGNPATWSTFGAVTRKLGGHDGLMFALGGGYVGFDADDCIDADGRVDADVEDHVRTLDSYTEVTPSGRGLHVILRGTLPPDGRSKGGREMYDGLRFFTMTGQRLEGTPPTIEHREVEVRMVHAAIFGVSDNPWLAGVVPAGALVGRTPRPVVWLTDKFIRKGELVLVHAPPGKMKSLLFLYWAACIAAGRTFLEGEGGRATRASRVLWVNTDNLQEDHEDRLWAVLNGLGLGDWIIPLYSRTKTDFSLADPDQVSQLVALAIVLEADVIIIDTLSGCLPGVDENSAKEMTGPANWLRTLASDGRTCVVLHHPNKADEGGYRGSSVLEGKVDHRIYVKREGLELTLTHPKTRGQDLRPIVIRADIENERGTDAMLRVVFHDGGPEPGEKANDVLCEKVLEAQRDAPGGLSKRALLRAVGGRWEALEAVLAKLITEGRVVHGEGARGAKVYRRIDVLPLADTRPTASRTASRPTPREAVREAVESPSALPEAGKRSRARKGRE